MGNRRIKVGKDFTNRIFGRTHITKRHYIVFEALGMNAVLILVYDMPLNIISSRVVYSTIFEY